MLQRQSHAMFRHEEGFINTKILKLDISHVHTLNNFVSFLCADRTLHAGLDDLLQAQQSSVDDPEKLVRAAAQGHVEICREIIRKHPNKVLN